MKWFMYCVSIILLLGLLSGCTNSLNNESTANQAPNHSESRPAQTDETAAEEPAEDVAKEPVELTIWLHQACRKAMKRLMKCTVT